MNEHIAIENSKPKDRYFTLSWSLSDEKKIERYTSALRQMYNKPEFADLYSKLADAMIDLVDKKHNDHHNATAELGHDWLKVEPINEPSFEDDVLTFQGINKLLKIYFGSASGVFKWVARGSATATPTPYDTTLNTETGSRQDSSTTGFHEIKGCSIRILSSYASTIATGDIYQIGIFDASTSGIMLAKHDFIFPALHHVVNVDAFSLGCVIDFIPFGDA
jgi:hypothetical protein